MKKRSKIKLKDFKTALQVIAGASGVVSSILGGKYMKMVAMAKTEEETKDNVTKAQIAGVVSGVSLVIAGGIEVIKAIGLDSISDEEADYITEMAKIRDVKEQEYLSDLESQSFDDLDIYSKVSCSRGDDGDKGLMVIDVEEEDMAEELDDKGGDEVESKEQENS